MQRREDAEHLLFPPAVYDDLKARYTRRIEEMIAYATNGDICRSRQLLRYFGETDSPDCGHCDVCQERDGHLPPKDEVAEAQTKILELLADGKPHHISALHSLPLPYEPIEAALMTLIHEEVIINDDGLLCLA
jgi:ATP-dependent DNA helicase RecQ